MFTMEINIMFLKYAAMLLFLVGASPACAFGDTVRLMPGPGTHRFPFFDTPTPVWSYNGTIPGPTIRAPEGTTLSVEVVNGLSEPTSVHWHGLRIDNAMDGVPGVTQDPIGAGERFVYRLRLAEAGTYWYHPHFNAGEQLERGLKGVLIVEEEKPRPWSQEWVWLLDDWLMNRDGTLFPHFNTHRDLMHDGRWGNVVTVGGEVKPAFSAAPGERIRIRLVNGANARVFAPTAVGLPATVVAVDGRPVSAFFPLDGFVLAPGNRLDLDITLPADSAGKVFDVVDRFTRRPFTLATIRVKEEPVRATPDFQPPTLNGFIPARVFDGVKVDRIWDLNAVRGGRFGIGWSINGRLWPDAETAAAAMGRPHKFVFANSSGRLHPMHLHGVFFRVLERNGAPAPEPFTRDTVLVGPGETVTIGFVPEHPGVWLAHCHIQAHAEAGMMTTVTVD